MKDLREADGPTNLKASLSDNLMLSKEGFIIFKARSVWEEPLGGSSGHGEAR